MGVASNAPVRTRETWTAAQVAVRFLLSLSLLLSLPVSRTLAQSITFSPSSSYDLPEEQPVGTAAAVLEAFYFTPFFAFRTDGIFSLDASPGSDAQYFSIETGLNADDTATQGTIRTAAVLDRDAEGSQTAFTFTVTYSTPDGSASSSAEVIIITSLSVVVASFKTKLYS